MSADSLYRPVKAQRLVDDSLGAETSVLNSQGDRDWGTGGELRIQRDRQGKLHLVGESPMLPAQSRFVAIASCRGEKAG